jgi:DNA-binding response OmpR family regulator
VGPGPEERCTPRASSEGGRRSCPPHAAEQALRHRVADRAWHIDAGDVDALSATAVFIRNSSRIQALFKARIHLSRFEMPALSSSADDSIARHGLATRHAPLSRILLIDDDASLLDALSIAFEDAGHEVLTAPDGVRGLERIRADRPDAVISDVNMPGLDGLSLCRRLREAGDAVPLVLLTSRDSEIDEALGLELGADDYVAKPFSTRVLVARIAALLRRESRRKSAEAERPVARGALELFRERLEVRYAKTSVVVTVTEFRLLEALASRAGIVLSRDRLLDIVRGDDSVVAERIIDTYVRRLRRKLEAIDPSFDRIETVIGAGYRWKDD